MLKSLKTQLTVLQQEGYSIWRFLGWWIKHPLTFSISSKKPLVLTSKARFMIQISYLVLTIFILLSLVSNLFYLSFIPFVIFLLSPFMYFTIALIVLWPYERINRLRTIKSISKQITQAPHLTVIGITGSFGKTSVKDFLYTILSKKDDTLKTPESYNTIFGVAKVVDLELLTKTKYFICEMGAYIRGEIKELCQMVPPDYAILTAIGNQHLERFKTIENTTKAKFELVDSVKPSHALVNIDNPYIKDKILDTRYKNINTYSLSDPSATFFVNKYHFTSDGTTFTLTHKGKSVAFVSHLFGTSNLYNLTAAISQSLLLNIPPQIIKERIKLIVPSPHRLEIKRIGKSSVIDNAFSSNEEGFLAIIKDLKDMKGNKVIITPGIIELGKKTVDIHEKIGCQMGSVFDKVILVGHSQRTHSLEKGLRTQRFNNISYIENSANLWPIVDTLSKKYAWILIENDLPDIF